ncbi:MAG: hypothetical protein LBI42_15010 [Chitinispirillales bacterium]|nr:hypothetical protein [Chitinispirillales bacterium]
MMNINIIKDTRVFFCVITVTFFVSILTWSGFSQTTDTAYIPFRINADAKVIGWEQNADTLQIDVKAGKPDTLAIYLGPVSSIKRGSMRTQYNAPSLISDSRGNITLRLPQTSYQKAAVSLHSVNGKRIINQKTELSESTKRISYSNIAPGIYILSVKGINAGSFSARLTHRGGKLNIGVAFGAAALLEKEAYSAAQSDNGSIWTISVKATGYNDTTYTLVPVRGINPTQNINFIGSFLDLRDSLAYRSVVIGSQLWMAENLNYIPDSGNSWCYGEYKAIICGADGCHEDIDPGQCDTYGRLYDWATAMNLPLKCNNVHSTTDPDCGLTIPNHRGICPEGYHIPDHADWDRLYRYADGSNGTSSPYASPTAGKHLKTTSGWFHVPGVTEAWDTFGFSALPGGQHNPNTDWFNDVNRSGYWWSTAEDSTGHAYYREIYYYYERAYVSIVYEATNWHGLNKAFGYSVRCVQNLQ